MQAQQLSCPWPVASLPWPRSSRRVRCRAAAAATASQVASLAPPQPLLHELAASNAAWLSHALANKLHDEASGATVHLLGLAWWAPGQEALVEAALTRLASSSSNLIILAEQPATAQAVPAWITVLQAADAPLAAALARPHAQQDAAALAALASQLAAKPAPRVGRVLLLDPLESFGFCPGLDYACEPSAGVEALRLGLGYLPGRELVLAAEFCQATGRPFGCVDAPLKAQEGWVRGLLQAFELDEQQVAACQPLKEFAANQALVSAAAAAWDAQLAAAADALRAAAAGGSAEQQRAAERQALLLFKAAKAGAAGTLSPEAVSEQVAPRMARLQPLKWVHFAARERHLALAIREAAREAAAAAAAAGKPAEAAAAGKPAEAATAGKPAEAAAAGSSKGSGPVLLVLVGRQHVAPLLRLWRDPGSKLWANDLPRTFAASFVERLPQGEQAGSSSSSSKGRAASPGA